MSFYKRKDHFDLDNEVDFDEKDYDTHSNDKHDTAYFKPPNSKHYDNCVEDVLEGILKAQRKVKKDDCKTSCQHPIDDLLREDKKPKKDTIPFILYCKCKPFKGSGVTKYHCHSKHSKFKCIETFVFKVKDIKRDCAVLELLAFKEDCKKSSDDKGFYTPCEQIDHKYVDDLMGTGICITVDLNCFCAITCLPALKLDS